METSEVRQSDGGSVPKRGRTLADWLPTLVALALLAGMLLKRWLT
jgi:hypothetical protein